MVDFNENNPMSYSARAEAATMDGGLRAYMLSVYNYMCSALALTGITAYGAAHWEPLMNALYQVQGNHMGLTGLGWLVMFAPLGFVLFLSMGINRMTASTAQMVFWAYAGVLGLSLSSLFFAYTGQSLVRVFFITSIVFGAMGMWGYSTKTDLTGMGHFLMMGVFGIILASIVNIFVHSSGLQFAVSVLGVVLFTGLTAYDTQKIKQFYYLTSGNSEATSKSAIMGALSLYLDFINLFIMLLRLTGDRR